MNRIAFFALPEDIRTVVEVVDGRQRLAYRLMGLFSAPDQEIYDRGVDIPMLGKADTPSAITCASYLVSRSGAPTSARPIPQDDGSTAYAIDQLWNPDTVVFSPAGVWNGQIVLSGRVDATSDSPIALGLMKLFVSTITRRFTKVRAFHVGDKALTWLNAGKRLTGAEQSPTAFDLTADHTRR